MEQKNVIGYASLNKSDIKDYDPKNEYCIRTIRGDCLNSIECPTPVKDGDKILCHKINIFTIERDMAKLAGKLVVIDLINGQSLIKQYFGYYEFGVFLRMYNPSYIIKIPYSGIKSFSLVDKIF